MVKSVLILANMFSPNVGGLETHLDDLCVYLNNRKYKVWVIAYQPLTTRVRAKHIEKRGTVEIHRVSWFGCGIFYRLNSKPILEFAYMFPGLFIYTLFFMLRNAKKVDVIHTQGIIPSCVASVLNIVFRKRMVMSTHSTYDVGSQSSMSTLFKWILRRFDTILCLSKNSYDEIINLGIDVNKIGIFTYWVNQSIFKPIEHEKCKKKMGWESKFVALFVGRLIEEKGIVVLLRASEALREHDEIVFAFVGVGPLAEDLCKASAANHNVLFIGSLKNNELPMYYSAADVIVIPSLTSQEGFPRVIPETLSCGTPVIGSNKGAISESIDESVGILTEPFSEDIANTIIRLSHLELSEMATLRKRCRVYAERRYSDKNAEVILNAYEG